MSALEGKHGAMVMIVAWLCTLALSGCQRRAQHPIGKALVFKHDLGVINSTEGKLLHRTIYLRNGTSSPISIADVKTSCSCLKATLDPCLWPPQTEIPLEVAIDLNGISGTMKQEVVLLSPIHAIVARLRVEAVVPSALRPIPAFIDLGTEVWESELKVFVDDDVYGPFEPPRILSAPHGLEVLECSGIPANGFGFPLRRTSDSVFGDVVLARGGQMLRVGVRWGADRADLCLVAPRVVFLEPEARLQKFAVLLRMPELGSPQVTAPAGLHFSMEGELINFELIKGSISMDVPSVIEILVGDKRDRILVW